MFMIPIFSVMVGSCLFRRPGAVRRNVATNRSGSRKRIGLEGSIRLAIRIFLPLDLPGQSRWTPSHRTVCRRYNCVFRYSDYASFLKVLGWFFVPLWVAVFAGAFRYVKA